MIVSVVTRGVSDDCNSQTVETGEAWLRLARLDGAFAFHASQDGERGGSCATSPFRRATSTSASRLSLQRVAAAATTFSEISYESRGLADLRNGS